MKQLYLLDLDRTVFNTELFLHDILDVVARHHQLDTAAFRAEMPRYRQGEFYDFYGQMKTMASLDQPTFDQLIGDHLGDTLYVYPDVAPWLQDRAVAGETTAIITVGQEPFQLLKLRHARTLDGLSRTIVPTNKGALIAQQLHTAGEHRYELDFMPGQYAAVALVDDNPATFQELGPATVVTTYHMARAGETYTSQPTPHGTTRITSLTELAMAPRR